MKVLFWSANFWPNLGGLERISQELVLSLHQANVEVRVIAPEHPDRPNQDQWHHIPIHRFPFDDPAVLQHPERVLTMRRELQQIVHDWSPDLLNLSGCSLGWVVCAFAVLGVLPTLVTLHGEMPLADGKLHNLHRTVLRSADWIHCCSRWTLNELLRHFPEGRAKSSVLLNALHLPRQKLSPPARPSSTLLCAGRLAPEKGFDVAIQALTHCGPEITLQLAGEGPQRKPLEELSRQLGLERRVTFLGRLEPDLLLETMSKSLAVVVPSLSEGFGLTALEAAWVGTPVIASNVGGLPEVVCHGLTGWLVPVQQPQAIAKAAQELHADPGRTEAMARAARLWVEQTFRWSDYVESTLQRYQQLVLQRESLASERCELSCLVAVTHREAPLKACLDGILTQKPGHFTVCVVDDSNTPGWAELTQSYGPAFRYVAHPEPRGLASCWARALELTRGTTVAFLHASSHYSMGTLASQRAELEADLDLEGCLGLTCEPGERPRRAFLFEALQCRRSTLERLPPLNPLLGNLAEAQWFVEAERRGALLRFLPQAQLHRAGQAGPDWSAEWQSLVDSATGRAYHEAFFALPPGLLHLQVENLSLFQNWCQAWAPYRSQPGEAGLQVQIFEEYRPWWPPAAESWRLTPRQQCQGQLTDWESNDYVTQRPALSMIYRPHSSRAMGCLSAPQHLTLTDLGRPLELLLLRWLWQRQLHVYHATVVAWQGQGVLLVGHENSGKSTIAAACLEAGWEFVADDQVVLTSEQGQVYAQGLHACIWLPAPQAVRFPGLSADYQTNGLEPKGLLTLAQAIPPHRLLRRSPVRAVVCPQVGSEPGLSPCRRSQALLILAASSFHKMPGAQQQSRLDLAHQAVQSVDCWTLELGPDFSQLAESMKQTLTKPQGTNRPACHLSK